MRHVLDRLRGPQYWWRMGAMAVAGASAVAATMALGQHPTYAANSACPTAASSTTTSCTFGFTGGEQDFTVPAGVRAVTVTAVGAPGGGTDGENDGGKGAVVTATVPVTVTTLYVEVGGPGSARHEVS